MITNRHAVIALLAVGVLGVSSCTPSGNDTGSANQATTTDNGTLQSTNTESATTGAAGTTTTTSGTTSNTTASSGAADTSATGTVPSANTTETGTAADTTAGSAGMAAETPAGADARDTTASAKKAHGKKHMKKKANKSGAYIPPRGGQNTVTAVDAEESVLETEAEGHTTSSATTESTGMAESQPASTDSTQSSNAGRSSRDAVIGGRMSDMTQGK